MTYKPQKGPTSISHLVLGLSEVPFAFVMINIYLIVIALTALAVPATR